MKAMMNKDSNNKYLSIDKNTINICKYETFITYIQEYLYFYNILVVDR